MNRKNLLTNSRVLTDRWCYVDRHACILSISQHRQHKFRSRNFSEGLNDSLSESVSPLRNQIVLYSQIMKTFEFSIAVVILFLLILPIKQINQANICEQNSCILTVFLHFMTNRRAISLLQPWYRSRESMASSIYNIDTEQTILLTNRP
jgi:hypothetical protein